MAAVVNRILRFSQKRPQKNRPPGGTCQNEMTLDCSFLSDSRNFFVQSRVISVQSYYLTSLVTSVSTDWTLLHPISIPDQQSIHHSFPFSGKLLCVGIVFRFSRSFLAPCFQHFVSISGTIRWFSEIPYSSLQHIVFSSSFAFPLNAQFRIFCCIPLDTQGKIWCLWRFSLLGLFLLYCPASLLLSFWAFRSLPLIGYHLLWL